MKPAWELRSDWQEQAGRCRDGTRPWACTQPAQPGLPGGAEHRGVLGRISGEAEAALEATLRRCTLADVVGGIRKSAAADA
jgi:hypothetical protein